MRHARLALFGVALLAATTAAIVAIRLTGWQPPPRWNPWAPLAIADPPGPLTRWKLERLAREPAVCRATLAAGGTRFEPVPDRATGAGCGFVDAVRIERLDRTAVAPFVLACPAAVALAIWERHTLQPAAERRFGEPVVRLEHLGSYACRNVYGRAEAPRSQHATAAALDVAGFVLQRGRRIRVADDWAPRRSTDAALAAAGLLHELRDGACEVFDGVLGPDYNAEHRDHFHLDQGRYRICR